MAFWDKFFRRRTIVSAHTHDGVALAQRFNYQSAFDAYNSCSVVNDGVGRIATAASEITPKIESNGVVAEKSRALDLLRTPSSRCSMGELQSELVIDLILGGMAGVVLVGNVMSEPVGIYRVCPSRFSIRRNSYAEIYEIFVGNDVYADTYYLQDDGRFLSLDGLKEFVHIKTFGEFSRLDPVREQIAIITSGMALNKSILRNGGKTSLIHIFKDAPTDEELQARMRIIRGDTTGSNYGGQLGIRGGEAGHDVIQAGLKPAEMEFSDLIQSCERQIYRVFGIPLPLVFADASTHDNFKTALDVFWNGAVIPLLNIVYRQIGVALTFRTKEKGVVSADINKIAALEPIRMDALKFRKDIGIETTNELRELLADRGPVDGGENLLVEARLVPIDTVGDLGNVSSVSPGVGD